MTHTDLRCAFVSVMQKYVTVIKNKVSAERTLHCNSKTQHNKGWLYVKQMSIKSKPKTLFSSTIPEIISFMITKNRRKLSSFAPKNQTRKVPHLSSRNKSWILKLIHFQISWMNRKINKRTEHHQMSLN